jgi:hypothetical protein
VFAAHSEHDGLADLAGDRVALGVVEKAADETEVGLPREELPLVVLLANDDFLLLSVLAGGQGHGVALSGEHASYAC